MISLPLKTVDGLMRSLCAAGLILTLASMPAYAQVLEIPSSAIQIAPQAVFWPSAEITRELARCSQLLRGLDIVARPLAPLKDHECGTPAPVELISVGRSPQVAFSPPVTVTCDMAAALHRWIKTDLQPIARKHLGGEIVRVDTMSSYSCRTAYNRKNTKLSEHGRANAVDIRAFMTNKGSTSEVLADWGLTNRDVAAQVAAAKKLEAQHPVAKAPGTGPAIAAARQPNVPSSVATGSIAAPPGVTLDRPSIAIGPRNGGGIGLGLPGTSETGLGLSSILSGQSRLGGPKSNEAVSITGKTDFLRAAHDSACQIFGTVLGPEANAAHRNHFHLDMAPRHGRGICE